MTVQQNTNSFFPRVQDSPTMDFDQVYITRHEFPLVDQDSNPMNRVVSYSYKQSNHYCGHTLQSKSLS